jgi:predicted XRE-type DNA-binding protein
MKQNAQPLAYTIGSGNVFFDLGLPNPEEHLLKARCAYALYDLIKKRGWTEGEAAQTLEVSVESVSAITRGHFDDVTLEQMMSFLKTLGCRIRFTISSEADSYQTSVEIRERKLEDVYETTK